MTREAKGENQPVYLSGLLKLATLTPRQELLASAGHCPTCRTRTLDDVHDGGGYRFMQCSGCRHVVVLESLE